MKNDTDVHTVIAVVAGLWRMMCRKNGTFHFGKLIFFLFLSAISVTYAYRLELSIFINDLNVNSSYEKIMLERESQRNLKLIETAPRAINSLHDLVNNDLVIFFKYYPYPTKTHIKAIYFAGNFPEGLSMNDFQAVMTDSSKGDYITHMKGIPYNNDGTQPKSYLTNLFFYSCPVYSRDAEYVGKISLYWKDKPNPWDTALYYTACSRASREVGQYL